MIEVHNNPDRALSDGPNSLKLSAVKPLVSALNKVDRVAAEISGVSSN